MAKTKKSLARGRRECEIRGYIIIVCAADIFIRFIVSVKNCFTNDTNFCIDRTKMLTSVRVLS